MEHSEINRDPCAGFLDRLDEWLGGEQIEDYSLDMQAHHDSCAACQLETRLARNINVITAALPAQLHPALQTQVSAHSSSKHIPLPHTESRQKALPGHNPFFQLLAAWRQPMVFVPAFAAVLVALAVLQLKGPDTLIDPQMVIIDGQEFTREEILQAANDLEIVRRYLDKYGSYPARVVQSQLEHSQLPLPPPQVKHNAPSI